MVDLLNGTTLTVSYKPAVAVCFRETLTFRFLSLCSRCVLVHDTILLSCSFDTIYHPTDFTVMNETQNYDVSF